MSDIFISYASEDRPRAATIAKALVAEGWSVWWDRNVPAGRRFADVIQEEISKARCVVVLWSEISVQKDWVIEEAQDAKDRGILVPVFVQRVQPPWGFRLVQAGDLAGWRGDSADSVFRTLCQDISALLDPVSKPAPAAGKPPVEVRRPGEVETNPDDGQNYVWIPAGEFRMGCSPGDGKGGDDEKPPHTVTISRGFWLGQTEVTQAAYQRVRGANPSHFKEPENPVETVTWNEARWYCEAVGGRLPTEAEWEYAARAGSPEPRHGELANISWYSSNSGGQTHPVGQKQKNGWGLHDMLGNVWEWVSDWYQQYYYKTLPSPAVDPKGPPSGTMRVLRGGCWRNFPGSVRASVRSGFVPEDRNKYFGFRCVREVIP